VLQAVRSGWWKGRDVIIGGREGVEAYRMRSVAGPNGYRGDYVEHHTRVINGKRFEFARIAWGDGGVTVYVTPYNRTNRLHEWSSRG
jgi:hypothetical protein